MSWTIVSLADVPPQPWRNGGGTTRELLAWPSAAGWRVRMSVADVAAPGPFSRFEGVERWFAVLEGEGVVLRLASGEQRLDRTSEPLRFDGGAAVDCTLRKGPTRDFNLMAAPGTARMRRVRGELSASTTGSMLLGVYAHSAQARVGFGGELVQLPAFHFAWRLQQAPARATVSGEDALWMEATT
jgi:uncharacterized protein